MPAVVRVLLVGSIASLLSTMMITMASKEATGYSAAGTNATSQWFWGVGARRHRKASVRHTLAGYAIHHASATFWAAIFEGKGAARMIPSPALRGGFIAIVAAAFDFGLMPRRFTPGFESHLSFRAIAKTYMAFGMGLWLGTRVHRPDLTPADRSDQAR
jgi:hypothetical protein